MAIDFELRNHVAWISFNRPERMNAWDAEAYATLSDAWQRVRDDADIRVAVVTGAGNKAFTAGADLKSYVGQQFSFPTFMNTQREPLPNRGLEIWKPIVAAVNGYCLGGGMTLLMSCDVRLAVPTAQFALAEVTRGIVPGNGGTQRILDQMPHAIAMEFLLTGRRMGAEEAARWGLINEVVDADQLLAEAERRADVLAANPPLAVQAAKELALRARGMSRHDGLRLELAMNSVLEHSADFAEARTAFADKRTATFRGE